MATQEITLTESSPAPTLILRPSAGGGQQGPSNAGEADGTPNLADAKQNVQQLAQNVRKIRYSFSAVAEALQVIDESKLKDSNGNVLVLRPRWQSLFQRFESTIRASLKQAKSAAVNMHITDVLDEAETTPNLAKDPDLQKEVIEEIDNFIQAMMKNEQYAIEMREELQKLVNDVQAFKSTITATLDTAGAALTAQLQILDQRLPVLHSDLERLRAEASQGCCGNSKSKAAAKEMEKDIAKVSEERNLAQMRLERLQALRSTMQQQMPRIDEIVQDINIISDIWGMIYYETFGLRTYLSDNFGSDVHTTSFTWRRKLTRAKEMYRELRYILEDYVSEASKVT